MYDVVIIGGGPAGLTAGVYAGRANLKTLIIEKGLPGGQMQNTLEVENYPGFEQILGPELAERMHKHALRFGADWKQAEVTGVELDGAEKVIETTDGPVQAKSVIIASGAYPRYLNVPGERKFAGRGVSYCATCDGAFFRDKRVIVVGGGDSAVEEGVFLTRFAASVTIVHRRDKLRAQPVLQERAFKNEKISFIWNSEVREILGDMKVTGVRIENNKTSEMSEHAADGVFIYVGFIANSKYLANTPILDEDGYIPTDEHMQTKVAGVYAVGDIRQTDLRQIVTATRDGGMAAMEAYHYLESQGQ